jgi:hypothetical protein
MAIVSYPASIFILYHSPVAYNIIKICNVSLIIFDTLLLLLLLLLSSLSLMHMIEEKFLLLIRLSLRYYDIF